MTRCCARRARAGRRRRARRRCDARQRGARGRADEVGRAGPARATAERRLLPLVRRQLGGEGLLVLRRGDELIAPRLPALRVDEVALAPRRREAPRQRLAHLVEVARHVLLRRGRRRGGKQGGGRESGDGVSKRRWARSDTARRRRHRMRRNRRRAAGRVEGSSGKRGAARGCGGIGAIVPPALARRPESGQGLSAAEDVEDSNATAKTVSRRSSARRSSASAPTSKKPHTRLQPGSSPTRSRRRRG